MTFKDYPTALPVALLRDLTLESQEQRVGRRVQQPPEVRVSATRLPRLLAQGALGWLVPPALIAFLRAGKGLATHLGPTANEQLLPFSSC